MVRIYAVNILPLKDVGCFENCYRRSSEERRTKADALNMPADKARCIAAGLLLAYAYKKFRIEKTKELASANSFAYAENEEVAKLPEELPKIREGDRGKPEFVFAPEIKAPVYFNLSHSGNYVMCAMADFEVGVDIQRQTRVRESIVRRFFTEKERKRMESCGDSDEEREMVFAQIWAVREAEAKLTGRGIGQMIGRMIGNSEKESECCVWGGVIEDNYAWAVVGDLGTMTEGVSEPELIFADEGELFYE